MQCPCHCHSSVSVERSSTPICYHWSKGIVPYSYIHLRAHLYKTLFKCYSLVWCIPVCMHAYLHIFMLFVSCHTAAILCTSVSFSVRYWLLHFMMVFVAKCLSIKIWTIVLCQLLLYIYFMKCYSLSHILQMLRVTELFMPSHQLLPLFSPLGYTKASLLEQSGVREVVTRYVKSNELASKDNPRCSTTVNL